MSISKKIGKSTPESEIHIERVFTENDPYSNIEFVKRSSVVRDLQGNTVGVSQEVIAPSHWSQIAVDILAQRYLRKRGVPIQLEKIPEVGVPQFLWSSKAVIGSKTTCENDARQVFHRLAGTWTYFGWKHNYFKTETNAQAFYDELLYILAKQIAAPNSPQFFNTGIYWAYGINGPAQGHYRISDTGEIIKSSSAYEYPQPHACFIQSVKDTLLEKGGIFDLIKKEARIFKYGSGSGTNWSNVRGSGECLSGGGYSSGVLSWLSIADRAACAVKSGGTTRRAARMVILNDNHPEIEDFVWLKYREEYYKLTSLTCGSYKIKQFITDAEQACANGDFDLNTNAELLVVLNQAYTNQIPINFIYHVWSLLKTGHTDILNQFPQFNTDFDGEGYRSIAGQSANNSVRISKELITKSKLDEQFALVSSLTKETIRHVSAKKLWNDIVYNAWACGDPGVQFSENINNWHTCIKDGPIEGSNPCSEYMFLDDTACNLASINLVSLYKNNQFDTRKFKHVSKLMTIILDISVSMAQYPSKDIAIKSHEYRPLGLGYANLGGLLMRMAIPYNSEQGRTLAAYITAMMHGTAYLTSVELAKILSKFPRFDANKEDMMRVLNNHVCVLHNKPCQKVSVQPYKIDWNLISKQDKTELDTLWSEIITEGEKYGFRNAHVTVIAPTGTIGLLMDCTSTGIEPEFSLIKIKKLVGGGHMRLVNDAIPAALTQLKYSTNEIDQITKYIIGSKSILNNTHINQNNLLAVGFTQQEIDKINKSVDKMFDVESIFSKSNLGSAILRRLKIEKSGSILQQLGFSKQQIAISQNEIFGHGILPPQVKSEHKAVFACANNEDALSPEDHIKMMAAVQPFLSGAISKTVNMPQDITTEDMSNLYYKSYELGLKAVAPYRNNSKLSQPLNTSVDNAFDQLIINYKKPITFQRGERESLPARSASYRQKVLIAGHRLYLHIVMKDGKVKEIFASGMEKEGTTIKSLVSCFCQLISIALQYGVPLQIIVDTFKYSDFEPKGNVIGIGDKIKYASSLPDLLVKIMEEVELEHQTHIHQKTVEENIALSKNTIDTEFLNIPCSSCGAYKLRDIGTCRQCWGCYMTTGC